MNGKMPLRTGLCLQLLVGGIGIGGFLMIKALKPRTGTNSAFPIVWNYL